MTVGRVVPVVALVALAGTGAHAHFGIPGGRVPFVSGGALIGGAASDGILFEEDGRWLQVCDEALGAIGFFHHRTASGAVLVGTSRGFLSTDDGGCTYAPVAGAFEGTSVAALAVALAVPERIFLIANDDDGAHLYRSDDAGLRFDLSASFTGTRLLSVVVSDDASRLYLSGAVTETEAPLALVSLDAGETFAERAFWPDDALYVQLEGLDIDGQHLVALVYGDTPSSTLLQVDEQLASPVELHTFDALVTGFAAFGQRRFVQELNQFLYVQDASVPGSSFALVEDGPTTCLMRIAGDARLWGCGGPADDFHFFATEDGATWTPFLGFDEVEARECPAGTVGQAACTVASPEPRPPARPPAVTPPTTRDDEGPSCAAVSGESACSLFAVAALFRVKSRFRPRVPGQRAEGSSRSAG